MASWEEISSLAGGAVQGFERGKDLQMRQDANRRAEGLYENTQTIFDRQTAAYEGQQELNALISQLPQLLTPGSGPPTRTPGIIPSANQVEAIPSTSPPTAMGGSPTATGGTPSSPGGALYYPKQPNASSQAAAANTKAIADSSRTGALPAAGAPQQPQQEAPKRRDQLLNWRQQALSKAAATGGLEAMQAVDSYFEQAVRGQMFEFGQRAVNAMKNGSPLDAAKSLNAAAEISPYDAGVEFVAEDGKLYMERNGKRQPQPLDQKGVQALLRQYVVTPENALDWRQADTAERYADVAERQATVSERAADRADRMEPAEKSLMGAQIINLLSTAADRMAPDGAGGLTPSERIRINNDIMDSLAEGKLGGMPWLQPLLTQPEIASQMMSGAIDIVGINGIENANYADAVGLSAIAYADRAGLQEQLAGMDDASFPSDIGVDDQNRPFAVYNNKRLYIPVPMYNQLMQMNANQPGALQEEQ